MTGRQIITLSFRLVLLGGFLGVLMLNLPGHLTYDSIAQLHEGRTGVRLTWGPAFYAWLLGATDRIVTGTTLYVVLSAAVLFGALATLPALRPRLSWMGVLVALLVVCLPHLLIAQAIVWKDIAFANAAVAGFICVAHAERLWEKPAGRWLSLAAALLLLAVAAQLRQNGALVGLSAAAALGVIAARGRWLRGLAWSSVAAVVYVLSIQALGAASLSTLRPDPATPTGSGVGFGIRLIQSFDLAGAVASDPSYDLDVIGRRLPGAAEVIETRAPAAYSAQRVDKLDLDPTLSAAISTVTNEEIAAQWFDLVTTRPDLYLQVRFEAFRWLIAPPRIDACIPISVGVDAAPSVLQKVDLSARLSADDVRLYNYTTWFLDTPLYVHGFYFLLSGGLLIFFAWRRQVGDISFAMLQLSSLAVTGSFFVISIACDWRYLYFTDLAALAGLIYLALDPSLRRRGRSEGQMPRMPR